jgi:hypothetical protein
VTGFTILIISPVAESPEYGFVAMAAVPDFWTIRTVLDLVLQDLEKSDGKEHWDVVALARRRRTRFIRGPRLDGT